MTWQDELRRLDEELAAGRLSAEEYRHLRDALLSSKGQAPTDPPPPAAEPQPAGNPFPPPFKWDDATDSTQVMRTTKEPAAPAQGEDAERTQVVTGRPAGTGNTGTGNDSDRTQVVAGGGQQMPPPPQYGGQFPPLPGPPQTGPPQTGPQQQQQLPPQQGFGGQAVPPWQQPAPSNLPPWGGTDLPPQTEPPPAWLRQGPESFEQDHRPSKAGKIIGIAVAALVVVGLTIGAIVFLGSRDGGSPGTTTPPVATGSKGPTTTQAPTTTEPPPPPVVQPAGAVQMDSTFTLQRLGEAQVLGPEDFEIMRRNQIGETQVVVTKQGQLTLGTWAFTVADRAGGERVLNEIETLYTRVNFKPAPTITPPNVSVLFLAPDDQPGAPTVFRAHYLAEDKVIRVEGYGPDPAQTETEFAKLLSAQLDRLPAEG